MSVSGELVREIDKCVADVTTSNALFDLIAGGRVSPQMVASYVDSIRHLLSKSPLHLRLAGAEALRRGDVALAKYFDAKHDEEVGHDQWAVDDLCLLYESFGVRATGPASAIRALVDDLEERIARDPKEYLAHILFAEYFTVRLGPTWITALETHCGIPANAMSAIVRHVDLDREHVRAGKSQIDELVSSSELPALKASVERSFQHFELLFEQVAAQCEKARKSA